jgi:tight adherence protein C
MGEMVTQIGGSATYLAILGGVFVGVLALFFGIRSLVASRGSVVKDRLRRTVAGGKDTMEELIAPPVKETSGEDSFLATLLGSISRVSRPSDEEELGRLRRRLAQAGLRGEMAMASYLAIKVILCLALGGLGLWWNSMRATPLAFQYAALLIIVLMMVGLYLPNLWLHVRVKSRMSEINHALPDAIDLVVTCVEAGLGLDSSLERVSREVRLSSPLLSRELAQTSLEMRAGMPRGDAFRRLATRTGVDELRNLAAIVVQTDIFGTSVAQSLRVQAESMRVRRTQLAEERAATVAVKMTIPLIFCILPALFAVLMGPATVKIIRLLLPTLGGPK